MDPNPAPWKLFVRGFLSPIRAGRFLMAHQKIKRYALLPFLVNCVAFLLLLVALAVWGLPAIDLEAYSPVWAGEWGVTALAAFEKILVLVFFLVLFIYGFSSVGLVIASPFNDMLSEKVEEAYCGCSGHENLKVPLLMKQVVLSFGSSLRIILWQGLFTVLALPFLLIPFLGAIPLFLVNAYFEGLGYVDIPLVRHFLRTPHRRAGMGDRRVELFGLGTAMVLLMLIPFLNLLALPLGVTAGTLLYCEVDWEGCLSCANLTPPPGYIPPRIKG
ncbi:MAG: EI24 domain-containing protein [Planctomycetota bacterium]|jgi:CysZ protein